MERIAIPSKMRNLSIYSNYYNNIQIKKFQELPLSYLNCQMQEDHLLLTLRQVYLNSTSIQLN